MPSAASNRAPHWWQDQSSASDPAHAGQASSSRKLSMRLREESVDEGRQRLDGRRENQHEAEQAEKAGQRHEPALAGIAAPQAEDEIHARPGRGGEHDYTAPDAATLLDDHATSSFSDVDGAATRLVTRV